MEKSVYDVEGGWFENVRDDVWATPTNRTFVPGKYEYEVTFSIKKEYADFYEFDDDCVLMINGTEIWRKHKNKDGDKDVATYYSEVLEIEPVSLMPVQSVEATSNIDEIFVNGNDLAQPEFDTNHEQCYVEVEHLEKLEEGYFRPISPSGKVTPGTYKVCAIVKLYKGLENEYELSKDTKLIVDGEEWTFVYMLKTMTGETVGACYTSPDIVISEDTPEPPIEEEGQWIEKYGSKYYELPDGKKATGIQKIGEDSYLFSKNGTLQKDTFYEAEGNKYYFGSDGKMVKGWFDKWSARYYTNEDGVVQTGFVDIEGNTYYFDAKGKKAASLWVNEDGKRFYIKADGRMAKAETINRWGKKYTFAEDGALIK